MNQPLRHQPDDPGIKCCPRCGYREPQDEEEVDRDVANREMIMHALYGGKNDSDVAEPKIVDVFICKTRKKLKAFGIEIKTQWGQGYYLDAETKRRVLGMMPKVAA